MAALRVTSPDTRAVSDGPRGHSEREDDEKCEKTMTTGKPAAGSPAGGQVVLPVSVTPLFVSVT
jgi:hypothetical protein